MNGQKVKPAVTESNSGGKRLKKMKEVEDEDEPQVQRTRSNNNQKRAILIDSDDEADKNNEVDVSMASSKENKNIQNMVKTQLGATVVDKEQQKQQQASNGVAKGRKKVRKQREYIDEDGYTVFEDYSSFEEYDIPESKEHKEPVALAKPKNAMNIATQSSKNKNQSSLAAFFGKK